MKWPFFIGLRLDHASCGGGSLFSWTRLYIDGRWSPFVLFERRYPWRSIWRGSWPKPVPPLCVPLYVTEADWRRCPGNYLEAAREMDVPIVVTDEHDRPRLTVHFSLPGTED